MFVHGEQRIARNFRVVTRVNASANANAASWVAAAAAAPPAPTIAGPMSLSSDAQQMLEALRAHTSPMSLSSDAQQMLEALRAHTSTTPADATVRHTPFLGGLSALLAAPSEPDRC